MPTLNNFYIDQALSRVASGWKNNSFIAGDVFPVVLTPKMTGSIYDIDPNRNFQIVRDNVRAPGNPANVLDYEDPTTSDYNARDHALRGVVPDEYRDQVDPEAEPALPTVERLARNIMLGREKELVTLIGTLSQTSSPSTKWDAAAGDAFNNIKNTAFVAVEDAVGATPNAIAMDRYVARAISESDEFKDRVKYTQAPVSGVYSTTGFRAGLAAILDIPVENVLIADAYENTAKKGQTASMSRVWGENVLVFYKENPQTVNDDVSQNLGMHIVYTARDRGGEGGFMVTRERKESQFCEEIVVHNYYDQFLLNAGAGYLFTDVLA